jgi:catechol 2,3-dioxygenase-like lactoylglutathione lyase family enzyme
MWDHVSLRVADLDASRAFYGLAVATLGFGDGWHGADASEWQDFSIGASDPERPVTRGLHVAFVASSRDAVDEWWSVMTDAGYRDDGVPGVRAIYQPDYYGGFVLDPDGNSVEAVFHGQPREGDEHVDHFWIRVADLDATRRFYATIAPVAGFVIRGERPERFHIAKEHRSSAFVSDGLPCTENVHLAFGVADNATVDEFHRVAVDAGYASNGPPGERPVYHAAYYGAFVLDLTATTSRPFVTTVRSRSPSA